MAKKSPTAAAAIKEIRSLLADWLEASDAASKPVAKIMRLLETVDAELAGHGSGGKLHVHEDETRYSIEKTAAGEVLTEGKGPGAPPFKVPKTVYDAVVAVLKESDQPLRFEDILEQVKTKTAAPPGDFQIRVCLRFWLASEPPLIARSRSTYHPISRSSFASAANRLWADTFATK